MHMIWSNGCFSMISRPVDFIFRSFLFNVLHNELPYLKMTFHFWPASFQRLVWSLMALPSLSATALLSVQTASINTTIATNPPNGFDKFIDFGASPPLSLHWISPKPLYDDGSYTLYVGGCTVNGHENCTASCQDPVHMFSSAASLSNCIAAPYIAENFSQTDSDVQETAKSFGITEDSFSVSTLNETLSACLSSFCTTKQPFCTPDTLQDVWYRADGGAGAFETAFIEVVCPYASTALDPDLGGIGVREIWSAPKLSTQS